jgi:N4-gp56 family major capsid protein
MENSFGVNDANAVKLWQKRLEVAERDSTDIAPLMGTSPDSIIHIKEETTKGPGDRVRFSLRPRLSGEGKSESDVAEGQGEGLSVYYDDVTINELFHVVAAKSENTIDHQRVPWDLREECRGALGDWWADRNSAAFFNQVCGNTAQVDIKYTGMIATTAPSSDRILRAGAQANDQSLTSSHPFVLGLIDSAVEKASVGNNKIRPLRIGGKLKYVMYLHPYQVTSLRTNTATGQWLDIQKAAMAGSDSSKSPIYTGALGEYNGVILRVSQDIPLGCNSSTPTTAVANTRRAVLLGAQAAAVAYGKKHGPSKYRWNEELLDHKRKLEVGAFCIMGMKKTVFNSSDFGALVVSTYAAAAA